jgi:hypothetical protein
MSLKAALFDLDVLAAFPVEVYPGFREVQRRLEEVVAATG